MNALLMSDLGAGFFVFILGLLIVFFGMLIIVLVISAIGAIMKASDKKKAEKEEKKTEANELVATVDTQAVDDKIKAAIVAVIAAYYFSENNDCSFKVKRIKKLN